jgi:hypothetical protein
VWGRRHTPGLFLSRNCGGPKNHVSDISGTDVYIHDADVRGVFRQLRNALVRPSGQPNVPQMMTVYEDLKPVVRQILRNAGTKDIYQAQVFSEIRLAAQQLASKQLGRH